jgi:protein-tyrosine phosphatase
LQRAQKWTPLFRTGGATQNRQSVSGDNRTVGFRRTPFMLTLLLKSYSPGMRMKPAVLFVCLGNICRSPMAEAAFRAECEKCRLNIEIDSAGIESWNEGNVPDSRATATAARHGIDMSGLRARQVRKEDFAHFDLILALDLEVFRDLKRMCPSDAKARVSMLLDHVPGREGQPVPDPYYSDERAFDAVWQDVVLAAQSLVAKFETVK